MASLSQQLEHSTDTNYFLSKSNTKKTYANDADVTKSRDTQRLAKLLQLQFVPLVLVGQAFPAITFLYEFSGLFEVEKVVYILNIFSPLPAITKHMR